MLFHTYNFEFNAFLSQYVVYTQHYNIKLTELNYT